MNILPIQIAAANAEETISIGDDVAFTVLDVQPNQACVSVIAPAAMKVTTTPSRKIFHANDGTRMGALRVGESLSIGLDISMLLLTANDGKARFGLNPGVGQIRKCASTLHQRRKSHVHGYF